MSHGKVRFVVLLTLLLVALGCVLGGLTSCQEEPTAEGVRGEAPTSDPFDLRGCAVQLLEKRYPEKRYPREIPHYLRIEIYSVTAEEVQAVVAWGLPCDEAQALCRPGGGHTVVCSGGENKYRIKPTDHSCHVVDEEFVLSWDGEVDCPCNLSPTQTVPAPQWEAVFTDTFVSDANGWATVEGLRWTQQITEGKYRWETTNQVAESKPCTAFPAMGALSDFYLSVEVRHADSEPATFCGLAFRSLEDGHYFFGVTGEGALQLDLHHRDETHILHECAPFTAFARLGTINRLSVLAEGSHFRLFVNDVLVAEADDDTLPAGQVGLGTYNQNSPGAGRPMCEFDNFEVRVPPGLEPGKAPPSVPTSTPPDETQGSFMSECDDG